MRAHATHRSTFGVTTGRISVLAGNDWLCQIVDACFAAVLILAPLVMGGRGPIGQVVFVSLPLLAAIAWCVRLSLQGEAAWRWSGAEWLLLAGGLLVILQLVPLPQTMLVKLSPALRDFLPLWVQGEGTTSRLGTWSTLSLTPEATRSCLTMYLSYVLLFVTLLQRLESVEEIGKLLRVVAIAAVVMALVGLAQFFLGSEKFLGIYKHPARSACEVVRGAFQNENHLAHFVSLGLGPLIWWSTQFCGPSSRAPSKSKSKKTGGWNQTSSARSVAGLGLPAILLSLAIVVLAGLLTFSRGGVLTMAIALVTCVAVMRWQSVIDGKTTLVLSIAAITNLGALIIFGFESLASQFGSLIQSTSIDEVLLTRKDLWGAMLEGVSLFYRTGTGIGSHSEVYPIFMEEDHGVEFTHGESGYMPLLLEAGGVGLVLMLLGIGTAFFWIVRTFRNAKSVDRSVSTGFVGCACAILPSIVASVVHSAADFVWYIPACMVLTIAQVACGCRLYQLARGSASESAPQDEPQTTDAARYTRLTPVASISLAVALTVTGWCVLRIDLGPALAATDYEAYMKYSVVRGNAVPSTPSQMADRLAAMEHHLVRVVQRDPRNARAHLRLAAVYLTQFDMAQRASENAMDLSQIRDAALASKFPTKEAQEAWLQLAFGDTRALLDKAQLHSRTAVRLCPLQGLGYMQLADLSFLESSNPTLKKIYEDQAARVRPYTGPVLFMRGKEAALVGDIKTAFDKWKRAFRIDPDIRQVIIDSLTNDLPGELFLSIFEPDTEALGQIFHRYIAKQRPEDAKIIGAQYAKQLCADAAVKWNGESAKRWHTAQETYFWLQDYESALKCERLAVEKAPLEYEYRLALAKLLIRHQQFAEAQEQFEWCIRRRPDSQELRHEMAECKAQQGAPTTPRVAEKGNLPGSS